MTNWQTSLGGVIAALGGVFTQQSDHTVQLIGGVLSAVGLLILGLAAKDHNVTGGSIPQASPPGAAAASDLLGANLPQVKNPS